MNIHSFLYKIDRAKKNIWFHGEEQYLCALISFAKLHWIIAAMLFSVVQSVPNKVEHKFKTDSV